MFCPKCGYQLEDGERFCSGCGADMQSYLNDSPAQPTAQQPVQPAAPVPPVQQYAQPVQPPVQQYAQPAQQYAQPLQTVPKKKKSKAPLIAVGAGAAALVIAGGGIGGFLAYQSFAAQKYVKENPTKAVANSYSTFISERKDPGTAGLFTLISNAQKKGTIKITYDYNYDYQGTKSDSTSTAVFSYDKDAKQYYLKAETDSLGAFFGAEPAGTDKKLSTLELFTDSKIVNLRYDADKYQGSYYLDAEHFRQSAQNSIFSPSKNNVNNLTDEQFEEAVSSIEKLYENLTRNMDQKTEEYVDKVVEIIEKNGNPEVTEETISVRNKNRDVYTVTYTFNRESLVATVKDLQKVMTEIAEENAVGIDSIEQTKESVQKTFDQIIENLAKADKELSVVLRSSLDRDSKQAAKLELTVNKINEKSDSCTAFIEFGNDAELDIYAELAITGENGGKANLTLKSTRDGSKTKYSADVYSKGTNEDQANTGSMTLVYDDSAKTYSLKYSVNGEEKTAVEGTADISENKASFTYEQPIMQYDYSKLSNADITTMDFIDMYENQVEAGKYRITIDISSDTSIVSFKGDKDIMAITEDEYREFGNLLGGRGSTYDYDYNYDYDDDNDYDDYNDYDYKDIDFNDSSYITAARGLAGLFSAGIRG